MKKIITSLVLIQATGALLAQNAFIKGSVSDSKTKETIVGASVVVDDSTGTATDINGSYTFKTKVGKHKAEFKYIGYQAQTKTFELKENDTLHFNIKLDPDSKTLDVVVVSAGKFEQNLKEVTVSMEVIKPSLMENKAITSVDKAVDQVPGVNIIDGQANIRGGAGFSYGAGSRVLIMVDEMPMLTADQGDVKWAALPIENCEQIEVIKGASSALFGSSAMNGVINFRTGYAKDEPETKITFQEGMYDKPKRKELVYWKDGNPTYSGINFYHAEKLGQLDLVVGGNWFNDQGYRYLETNQRIRFNTNLRYRFKKIPGLAVGVNFNSSQTKAGFFILWANPDSALYPAGGDLNHFIGTRTNVDPFITYYNAKHNVHHSLRGRFYRSENQTVNDASQDTRGDLYYLEYQYQKRFAGGLTMTAGGVYHQDQITATLYGNHKGTNMAAFAQFDKKYKRLSWSFGIRGEYYKMDSIETHENVYFLMDHSKKPIATASKVKPVLRAGLNYHLFEATYLRASFGQGFRFPTVAERFIRTSASGLDIYPNQNLQPESGWSSEIGVKQGLKLGNWKGFLDVAAFWTEYNNMMEFTFGQYGPIVAPYKTPSDLGLGFQSQNIGNTRIRGIEASIMGLGKMGPIDVTALLGYTYIDPRQTDFNAAIDTVRNTLKTNLLKYRFVHTGKADVELGYKRVSTGISMRANSFMENIDAFFENTSFFPGMKEYRAAHDKGDVIFDYRLSYQLNKEAKIAFVINNMFNREVMDRPANILPQRVFVLQLTVKL